MNHWNQQSPRLTSWCKKHLRSSSSLPTSSSCPINFYPFPVSPSPLSPLCHIMSTNIRDQVPEQLFEPFSWPPLSTFLGWRGQFLNRLKQVWNVGNAVLQWFNGKAIRQGTRREESRERVSGFERQWCRARDTKRLHSLEGNILSEPERDGERGRGGEVISPPEHIHFTVFSSTLPLDITSFPSSDYPSIHHYICGKKRPYTHTYHVCALTLQKETASSPWQPLEEPRDFLVLLNVV